jgi:3-oxoacyl-[acyl-carrier-protein] synthase III
MKKQAYIKALSFYVPENKITNVDLKKINSDIDEEKLQTKIGLQERYYTADDETALDLAVKAAEKIFEEYQIDRKDIDFVVLCTQSPDYYLPTSACILQDRLGLGKDVGAFDINLGCSGFEYSLSVCQGLIQTNENISNILLVTAETYSKYVNKKDTGILPVFGDGASATLVAARQSAESYIGPFKFGTDGSGCKNLIVPAGGARLAKSKATQQEQTDALGRTRTQENIFMDGRRLYSFSLRVVPKVINELIQAANTSLDEIDFFIFHQTNKYLIHQIADLLGIDREKCLINLHKFGNTVSSTVPIVIKDAVDQGIIKLDYSANVILCGFGVGYSWSACKVRL